MLCLILGNVIVSNTYVIRHCSCIKALVCNIYIVIYINRVSLSVSLVIIQFG